MTLCYVDNNIRPKYRVGYPSSFIRSFVSKALGSGRKRGLLHLGDLSPQYRMLSLRMKEKGILFA